MKKLAEQLALSSESYMSANAIADAVFVEIDKTYNANELGLAYTALSKDQIIHLVYNLRQREFGAWESQIKLHPRSTCSAEDRRMFLQFCLDVNIDDQPQKVCLDFFYIRLSLPGRGPPGGPPEAVLYHFM